MSRGLVIADLFCGAGGTSTGALAALRGRAAKLIAVNHWDRAIETHTLNHPAVEHHCSNVYRLAPKEAVPGGRLDLLMASPTCTYFSRARGGKPISHEQRYGRMTPTQVVRWCTELRVERLLIENVSEFQQWGPVHEKEPVAARCVRKGCKAERPCQARRGAYFRGWIRRLEALGFNVEWRVLNSADFGDVTTRQRFYLLGRRDGKPIRWPTPSHSKDGEGDLFTGKLERWRPASEVIDWSIRGSSIYTRKKPLSVKTLARIHAGAVRFGWPAPFLVILRQHMSAQGIDVPLPTITASGTHVALVEPQAFVLSQHQGGAPRSAKDPIPTLTTDGAHSLIQPFLIPSFGERPTQAPRVHSLDEPAPTVCATGRINLVHAGGGYDVLFRMLQPHELAAAMGFEEDYQFAGNKTEVLRQIGNAVSVNTAQALVASALGLEAA